MGQIKNLIARERLNSQGIPTIEGRIELNSGVVAYAQIPSGTSVGNFEGVELRDNDPARYGGKGVLTACSYITNAIAPKLIGVDISQREDIDAWLLKADGTEKHTKLGVNTLQCISILLLKAQALEAKVPLYQFINQILNKSYDVKINLQSIPSPMYNMINGALHGSNNLNFQEIHIIASSSTLFPQSLELAQSFHSGLLALFQQKNIIVPTSDEGGYMPVLPTNVEALDTITELALGKKLKMGLDIFTGIDFAADNFFKDRKYALRDKPSSLDSKDYIAFILEIAEQYTTLVLEDPLHSEDLISWQALTKEIGDHVYVIGDDVVGGNKKRLDKILSMNACNVITFKLNQVATMTELFTLIALVRKAGLKIMVSQRMNETLDDFIVDLAVGVQADFVKFGSPYRGERVAKYNRLLQIDSELLQK